ncbi:L-amino acid N-acyltransferase YncA [Dysgonomonas alginatilytica]|uniref:L-amino acid N-acyltransferase YncA n=1 Tax=Dysgonomonas alginatilytica TaxID=1605892 RepID=A0A2V3PL37_9BACT|nr:GNAT family N-acetyltransferase [Dysgonomonas alginatilytica]PXV61850.1 L-amino acid N-acyltransferase YncA [Dysgonomonas alginatilytica]
MEIIQASTSHIPTIQDIAIKSWEITYADILSREQMNYMIEMMYSTSALKKQMTEQNHHFLLIKNESSSDFQGFISYEFNYKNQPNTKIHKLYLLPECKGKGMGRILIDKVATLAQSERNNSLSLNMNRDNKSIGFYNQMGFEIVGEEDNDIGSGYLMEDYILEKKI